MMKHVIDKTTMSQKHYYSFKPPRVFWQQTYSLKACFLSILLLLHHLTHLPRQSFHLGKNDCCNAVNPTYISPLSFFCLQKTGAHCICHNNTMSDMDQCPRPPLHPRGQYDDKCLLRQCSKCMEYYIGFPEKNHQCYRQMSVDTDYCLDPQTQSECNRNPTLLHPGQATFFVVLPKFMNVDIRIVLDVIEGQTEVYLSPEPKMFVVQSNQSSWEHEVVLDPHFRVIEIDEKEIENRRLRNLRHFFRMSNGGPMVTEDVEETSRHRRAHIRSLLPQLASNTTTTSTYR